MTSPTRNTLKLVSLISAAHLAFELFAREHAPLGALGNLIMAAASGWAFLQAELTSIQSMALGRGWQRGLGFLTYAAMMVANGVVQTAYYAQEETALLHEALGWWIVLVAVGLALQFAAELHGQQRAATDAEAAGKRAAQAAEAEARRKQAAAEAEAQRERDLALRRQQEADERARLEWQAEQRRRDERLAWERQQADAQRQDAARLEALRLEAALAEKRAAEKRAEQEAARAAESAAGAFGKQRAASESASGASAKSGKEVAWALLDADPTIPNAVLAQRSGVSESAVRAYRTQWKAARETLVPFPRREVVNE